MAFQTSFLRGGEWVTETVDLQSALRQATAATAAAPVSEHHLEPPACGVLSRTVIESPIVHRVLPVRLRSKTHNDIAFIGVSSRRLYCKLYLHALYPPATRRLTQQALPEALPSCHLSLEPDMVPQRLALRACSTSNYGAFRTWAQVKAIRHCRKY